MMSWRLVTLALALTACGSESTPPEPGSETPPGRWEHAMVYDAARQEVLLFGGVGAGGMLNDIWAWDGDEWIRRTSTTPAPSPRASPLMTYDSGRQRVVLYGGRGAGDVSLTDYWEWNGTAWAQLGSTGPDVRHASIGYDVGRQTVLLHRGFSGQAPLLDTYSWNGSQWSQVATTVPVQMQVPLPSTMVYDPARQALLMLTGDALGGATRLLEWNGTSWIDAGAGPAMETPAPITARGSNSLLALNTNPSGSSSADTWQFNGTTWTRTAISGPTKRFLGTAAFDPVQDRVLVFGGLSTTGQVFLNDTWSWNGTGWLSVSP